MLNENEIVYLEEIIKTAGKNLNDNFNKPLNYYTKKNNEWFTDLDLQTENYLIKKITDRFSKSIFIAEETINDPIQDGMLRWVIDPIDGTNNFIKKYPFFCISVALEFNGEIVLGLIYDPLRDEMFKAVKNKGSFLNNHKINVSPISSLYDSIIATGFVMSKKDLVNKSLESLKKIMFKCKSFRRIGSAALDLAYLASGRLDGCWYHGLSYWDFAAGKILVEESDGIISDSSGYDLKENSESLVASNSFIFKEFLSNFNV